MDPEWYLLPPLLTQPADAVTTWQGRIVIDYKNPDASFTPENPSFTRNIGRGKVTSSRVELPVGEAVSPPTGVPLQTSNDAPGNVDLKVYSETEGASMLKARDDGSRIFAFRYRAVHRRVFDFIGQNFKLEAHGPRIVGGVRSRGRPGLRN